MKSRARRLVRFLKGPLGHAVLAPNLRFRVQHWRVETPLWGDRPSLRIAVLSDLHWGYRPVTTAMVAAVKRRVAALAPDLVVFLGDLAEGRGLEAKARHVEAGAAALAGLGAPLGCYAVLGNHDWHDDAAVQRDRVGVPVAATHLERAGYRVLQNTALRPGREDIWLAGLASQQAFKEPKGKVRRTGADDLTATLAAAPGDDPIVLLAHEPDIFPALPDPRVVLTLSGHMHAGQIRLFGRALYAPSRYGTRFDYGHFEEAGRHLIVSGGLGCSTIPLRIGIVPEITCIECCGPGRAGSVA
ncbi:MAG: metallophosphoesterase [Pseudomonadota bacterium]